MSDSYNIETEIAATHRWSNPAGEVFGALAKAQAEIKNAVKDSTNPHFKSRYADLAAVKEACWGPLTGAGIAVVQMPINRAGDVGVVTLFAHSSGQWIESTVFVQPTKFDAQGVGSVITYLRRYALAAMAGVAPDDDDGEAAVGRPQGSARAQEAPRGGNRPAGREQAPTASADAENEAKKRWVEIRGVIDEFNTVPDLDGIERMPAWAACRDKIAAARGQAAANEAMDNLRNRIEDRKALLLDDARGSLRPFDGAD
jgi:hypothetical protein